ncbi:MAG: 4Fe-4S dicluster domain-containing protein [Bacteroidales bacterium]|jgi:Fe-S oxidoreductase|nr:4Fe-4S dicluster domain-containing protein [Bacteroidales bacterium]
MRERFIYDPFVLPFMAGFIYILIYLFAGIIKTVKELPYEDRKKLGKSIFSRKIFVSIKEIFIECLIHRKIWKRNPVLGYMHMSIAFGWFMLIILGHLEVQLYCPDRVKLPYFPIFFRYFMMETETTLKGSLLFFLMDFFLLMVLTGIGLAIYKRINSRLMGMRRTTKLKIGDSIAVYTLWAIFPLRLLAESFTSGISGGSFLTRGFGLVFESFVHNEALIRPMWWAYSIALGAFFFALPFSRFMHIPTEILLIVLRNAGIKSRKTNAGYGNIELYSCSRCGICIDACQMSSAAHLDRKTTVYFMRMLRDEKGNIEEAAQQCLMCGRCVDACPVGIDSCRLKQNVRRSGSFHSPQQYQYIPPAETIRTDVLYFAGCMSHVTPGIEKAMRTIFEKAGVNYRMMDEGGGICCGRPVMLLGQEESAAVLIRKNTDIILQSNAKLLVTSCPICFKVFNEEYDLPIPVMHHTQYIEQLLDTGKISVNHTGLSVVYHDPCDLGRNSGGIYQPPRQVLYQVAYVMGNPNEREKSLCCGASVGNAVLTNDQRRKIARDALEKLTEEHPDILVTACPLCKKTFAGAGTQQVEDIAQIVVKAMDQ